MPLLISGLISSILGLVVLVGWYTHNATLIQVLPSFVPMQYNTAMGFFLSGLALLLVNTGRRTIAGWAGLLVSAIGLLTLIEYVFGVDLGIDQLVMEHYVNVKTSHPGRMAPNTAVCFLFTGLAVLTHALPITDEETASKGSGILGAVTAGLGFVALFGYISGLETAYGWGHLTRMAVHTSLGFVAIGIGLFAQAVLHLTSGETRFSRWIAYPVGIGSCTVSIVLWQAAAASAPDSLLPTILLIIGLILGVFLSFLTFFGQVYRESVATLYVNESLLVNVGRMGKIGGWDLILDTGKILWTEEVYKIHGLPSDQPPPTELEHALSFVSLCLSVVSTCFLSSISCVRLCVRSSTMDSSSSRCPAISSSACLRWVMSWNVPARRTILPSSLYARPIVRTQSFRPSSDVNRSSRS